MIFDAHEKVSNNLGIALDLLNHAHRDPMSGMACLDEEYYNEIFRLIDESKQLTRDYLEERT